MRAANAFAGLTLEEIGVGAAPDKTAGVLVNGIRCHGRNQIAQREEGGRIGIVHHVGVAKAVHLEGIDVAKFRVLHHGILLQGRLHLIGQGGATGR